MRNKLISQVMVTTTNRTMIHSRQSKWPLSRTCKPPSCITKAECPRLKLCWAWERRRILNTRLCPKSTRSNIFVYHSAITQVIHMPSKPNSLLTIGSDGCLKIFDVQEKTCLKSFKICEFHLSCIAVIKEDEIFAVLISFYNLDRFMEQQYLHLQYSLWQQVQTLPRPWQLHQRSGLFAKEKKTHECLLGLHHQDNALCWKRLGQRGTLLLTLKPNCQLGSQQRLKNCSLWRHWRQRHLSLNWWKVTTLQLQHEQSENH